MQQQLLPKSEAKKKTIIVDDNQALPIVKEITKMQLPHTDSAGNGCPVPLFCRSWAFYSTPLKHITTCTLSFIY